MVTDESKYIVYFRNGKYHVCRECYKNMLTRDEIVEEGLEYSAAFRVALDKNWEMLNKNL